MLYNSSVSKRLTIMSQTKEASIEPAIETLSLSTDPRENGLVKAALVTIPPLQSIRHGMKPCTRLPFLPPPVLALALAAAVPAPV